MPSPGARLQFIEILFTLLIKCVSKMMMLGMMIAMMTNLACGQMQSSFENVCMYVQASGFAHMCVCTYICMFVHTQVYFLGSQSTWLKHQNTFNRLPPCGLLLNQKLFLFAALTRVSCVHTRDYKMWIYYTMKDYGYSWCFISIYLWAKLSSGVSLCQVPHRGGVGPAINEEVIFVWACQFALVV